MAAGGVNGSVPCHVVIEPDGFGIFDSSGDGVDAALDALLNDGPLAYAVRAGDSESGSRFCCISTRVPATEALWVALSVREPSPWNGTLAGLSQLARNSGAETLLHWPPTCSSTDAPHLLCRKESLGQLAAALVQGGCLVSPAISVCPVPDTTSLVLPANHVGAWKKKGSVPEVIRLQAASGLFVDVSLPDLGSSAFPQASCGITMIDGQGLRRHCLVDFSPPQGPPRPRPVALSPQGNVLRIGSSSEVTGTDEEEEWQRLDLDTSGPPTFAAFELESEEPAGTEPRAGLWLFCGSTFARCIGPRVGEGLIARSCCKDLAHLRKWKGIAAVDRELSTRYEAVLGTVDKPGVLRLIRQAWTHVVPDTFFLDTENGIGGEICFLGNSIMEHRRLPGQLQRWIVRAMPFNPLVAASAKVQVNGVSHDEEAAILPDGTEAEYFSKSAGNIWIPCVVKNFCDGYYVLDVHPRAVPSKVRPKARESQKRDRSSSSSSSSSGRRKEQERSKDKKKRSSSSSSRSRSERKDKHRDKRKSRSRSKVKRRDKKRRAKSKQTRSRDRRKKSRSSSDRRRDKKKERSRSRTTKKKNDRSKSGEHKPVKDRALSRSPQPAPSQRGRFEFTPAVTDLIANAKTGQAAMKALAAQVILRSGGLPQSLPPSAGVASALAGLANPFGPKSSPDEVDTFLLMNPVDPEAATRLRSLPPHLQRVVMDRGPLMGTRNPSSVLIVRIRDAETGRGVGMPNGLGMPAPPPTRLTDPNIERMIIQYNLDARAAGMLRSLPPEQQRAAAAMPLQEARNPSAFVMAQLSQPSRWPTIQMSTTTSSYNVL